MPISAASTAAPGWLVIAGLSVRAAAEAARRDGFAVIGLDAFGDADTRAACAVWQPLALDPKRPWLLDPASLDAALRGLLGSPLAQAPGGHRGAEPTRLVLTGGFDAEGAALAPWLARWQQALGLHLAGTTAADLAGLRDPRHFFARLDALEIAHPPVAFSPPTAAAGWLRKDFGASGGWHVQPVECADTLSPAACAGPPQRLYWQRRLAGRALSLTLLGNGERARLLGLNRQLLAPAPGSPFCFGGVVGPCPAPAGEAMAAEWARWAGWADRLAEAFRLRGLVSLDLLRDDARSWLLEVNPRPSASLLLYGAQGGLMRAHLAACAGELPDAATLARLRGRGVRGHAIVYCPAALALDPRRWQALHRQAARLGLHDLPAAPLDLAAADPLCSISAQGADLGEVTRRLAQRRAALDALLAGRPALRSGPARPTLPTLPTLPIHAPATLPVSP